MLLVRPALRPALVVRDRGDVCEGSGRRGDHQKTAGAGISPPATPASFLRSLRPSLSTSAGRDYGLSCRKEAGMLLQTKHCHEKLLGELLLINFGSGTEHFSFLAFIC